SGSLALLTAAAAAGLLLVRPRSWGVRRSGDSLFLTGWVLLEMVGFFVLTPFPAARRVIGVTVALALLAARVVSRMNRVNPDRRPPAWVLPFGVVVGFAVAALDTYDAFPEKVIAGQVAAAVRDRDKDATVWYAGHWGFQY